MTKELKFTKTNIPIRQDITVLPADNAKPIKLPFVILDGHEVLKDENIFVSYKDNPDAFEEITVDDIKPKIYKYRLKNFDDIKNGDMVYSLWYDEKVVAMKVEDLDPVKQTALGKLSDNCWGQLNFGKDFRKCWSCDGFMVINDKAIMKLEVTTDIKDGN